MQQPVTGVDLGGDILTRLIPPEEWSVYADVFAEGLRRGIRFVVGGGLAVSAYAGQGRYTKDMDLFVREEEGPALLQMLRELGFDEYTEFPYDRTWSYRACRRGAILDVLWRTLNGKHGVDNTWLTEGWELMVRDSRVRLIPVEELIVTKLYIVKSDRTDWPDILNLLHAHAESLQWRRLLDLLGEDRLLMGGVMSIFRWLCPGRACKLPVPWESLGLLPPQPADLQVELTRVALLAAERWFVGATP